MSLENGELTRRSNGGASTSLSAPATMRSRRRIPALSEAVIEVTDFEGGYGGDWKRVRAEVKGINKTDEDGRVATASMCLVVSDRSVRKWGGSVIQQSSGNLVKVTAHFVEEVSYGAICGTFNLRHVVISPDVVVYPGTFVGVDLLQILAVSVGFKVDTGEKVRCGPSNWNDPTVGITRYLKWRMQMDFNKGELKTIMSLLQLANTPLNGNFVGMRATTDDPLWEFLAGRGRDISELESSFKFGAKRGEGDLRGASKKKLLKLGLEVRRSEERSNVLVATNSTRRIART